MEKAIHSSSNSARCRIPELPLHSPDIDKFLEKVPPLACEGKHADWIRCSGSRCFAQPRPLAEHFQLHCTFVDILRRNDYEVMEPGIGRQFTFKSTSDYFDLIESDYVRVKCKSSKTGERWTGVAIGVRKELQRRLLQRPLMDYAKGKPFNVLIFGFDSLSRNAFVRKLPKSYAYLTETIGAHVLTGYNIVGDGTPQALIPILTGHSELELPETRKRKQGSVSCDAFPMIWRYFRRGGYVTGFNEDLPKVGTFTYRLNGFDEQPTDHYMRSYFLATDSRNDRYERLCTGDRPRHSVFMNYTIQLLEGGEGEEQRHPKFIFSFHGELSHDSINLIEVADEDFLVFLKTLVTRSLLEDTILVVMSDHGNRFADVRDTFQGKLEERLPFFSFAFPERFQTAFPKEYKTFVTNSKGRLVTPFDINRTLRHILELQRGEGVPPPPNMRHPGRALSLFTAISENRSCANAYIEPHWCSCLQWTDIKSFDNRAIRAAITVTDHINKLTLNFREICAQLKVERIVWVGKMAPSDNLVQFQAASDRDGYLGSFDETRKSSPIYQVKLVTKPGNGIYEATVQYDPVSRGYVVDTAHISRVNKYGDQADCIYARDPELRKFCYCK